MATAADALTEFLDLFTYSDEMRNRRCSDPAINKSGPQAFDLEADSDQPEDVQDRFRRYARARTVCIGCPLAEVCREDAEHYQLSGVYGGTVYDNGRALRRYGSIDDPRPMPRVATSRTAA